MGNSHIPVISVAQQPLQAEQLLSVSLWCTVTIMSATASEVASTINSLMRFSGEDQERMLEVIGDFFTYPTNSSVHDPEEEFSDDDEMEMDTGNNNDNTAC